MNPNQCHVLVVDAHIEDPPFGAPRWFPAGVTHERVRVAHGEELADDPRFTHLILSGSAHSIVDDYDFVPQLEATVRSAHTREIPIFGICYGSQMIARALLGRRHVRRNAAGLEVGWLPTDVVSDDGGWLEGLPNPFHTWHYHYDEVCSLPADFTVLASTPKCAVQAWWSAKRKLLGTQFHPEMDTGDGNATFRIDREKLREQGVDADALIASTRDDAARVLVGRFLHRDW